MEKVMLEKTGVEFKGITCGKLRRYLSWENCLDAFRVIKGTMQAFGVLKKIKADKVYSTGGYVSVPVVLAAWMLRVPVFVQELDVIPGLANKICFRFAKKICLSFEESKKYLEKYERKIIVVGSPVRREMAKGEKAKAYKLTALNKFRPVILVMGGSQGAEQINNLIDRNLSELTKKFQIVHIRGRGNLDISLHKNGYVQYEFLGEELKDLYAMCELVITRGGAGSLAEIALNKKRAVVIPLGLKVSRGDQIENAKAFAKRYAWTVLEGEISDEDFIESIKMTFENNPKVDNSFTNGTKGVCELILKK
jgi:UDP-N-acetylglucosamine--N-acetylmuramyl-(pentapeptide) pyrophosphoryl-undecaprenol N-acetylglucosamine transferase